MTRAIDLLPRPTSCLSGLDPRWKLAALLLAAAATTTLHTLLPAASALAGAAALAVLARLPWRWCLARLGAVVLVVGPFLLLLPFFHSDDAAVWHLGPLTVSQPGVIAALVLGLKTLTLVLLMLVLLTTAPLTDTFTAAQRLRVPGLLVQLALLTYRYVFVLAGELARLRLALRVRAYRNRANLHSYRTVGHVAGMMLVRGHERAERVGQAMRCRGWDGRFRSLTDFRTRPIDVMVFVLIVAVAAGLVGWDLAAR